jgi:hypothetical protein
MSLTGLSYRKYPEPLRFGTKGQESKSEGQSFRRSGDLESGGRVSSSHTVGSKQDKDFPTGGKEDRKSFNKASQSHLADQDWLVSGGALSTQRRAGLFGKVIDWALGNTDDGSHAQQVQTLPPKKRSVDEIV